MSKLTRHVLGWSLLVLGVAGLALPILQGWLFIGLGALLLSPEVAFFKRLVLWIERRFPPVAGPLQRLRARLSRPVHLPRHLPHKRPPHVPANPFEDESP